MVNSVDATIRATGAERWKFTTMEKGAHQVRVATTSQDV